MKNSQTPETPTPPSPDPVVISQPEKHYNKQLWVIVAAVVITILAGTTAWYMHSQSKQPAQATKEKTSKTTVATPSPKAETIPTISSGDLKLDEQKNYGNKYASGILPVGDSRYVTSGPKQGHIYLCRVPRDSGVGAGTRGPWFNSDNTTYDITKKAKVAGNVSWQSQYSMNISDGKRTIATNDLPNNHTTGVFPVQSSDPAYRYDRNPNSIGAQSLTYSLTASPSVGTANCIGGEVGIMTTGVALFDGFDAAGRDAGAWEVQDGCSGHPQNTHEYHYHTLSSCIKDANVKTVIGYALDGFPITGPTVSENNILTTSDLDECHGITSEILLDGKKVISYHYVMTQDFPYSVSCFKAVAMRPPGQP